MLAADIHLPNTSNTFPAILIMTPYNRSVFRWSLPLGIDTAISSSRYAVVITDWRCFYGSTAACSGAASNGEDGYDVIDWIVQQTWSNGKVGTWGPSALGRIQYLTARESHPGHTCMIPLVASPYYRYQEYFPGGMARKEMIEQLDALGFGLSTFLYANPVYNATWQFGEPTFEYAEELEVPALMIGGWYDHNVNEMWDFVKEMRQFSPSREDHKALFGPWVHGGSGPAYVGTSNQGELSYPSAAGWNDSMAIKFINHWLGGDANGWELTPPVTYFQMGENSWKVDTNMPIAAGDDTLFFGSQILSTTISPVVDSVSVDYDPRNPSPTIGGPTLRADLEQGPHDQFNVEQRQDALIFTSSVLQGPAVVRGRIRIMLCVASDRPDTDIVVRITDVYGDGRSMLLTEANRRMRFRNGYRPQDSSSIIPGARYEIELITPPLAHTFLAGHRIRLVVTGSNYPRLDANINNGGAMYQPGDTFVASTQVFVGGSCASFIVLPSMAEIVLEVDELVAGRSPVIIYPNPARGTVHVSIPSAGGGDHILIWGSRGELLGTHDYNGNSVEIRSPSGYHGSAIIEVRSDKRTIAIRKVLFTH